MNQAIEAAVPVTQAQVDRIDRVGGFLSRLCKEYAESRSELHWVDARKADGDDGSHYCYDCACKKVAELNAKNPEDDYYVDGGSGFYNEDCPRICGTCGETLDCGLTDAGLNYELDHFELPDVLVPTAELTPSVAYSLHRIFECSEMACLGGRTDYLSLKKSKQQQRIINLSIRVDAMRVALEAADPAYVA